MNQKPKRNPQIESKVLPDGHAVLFARKTDWAITINSFAALVWEFCDGTNSLGDIVEHLQEIKEVDQSAIKLEEIESFIEELEQAGFLED